MRFTRAPVALLGASLLLALSAPGSAGAQSPAELSTRAASLADSISVDWSHSLDQSGAIVNPLTGQLEGGYGRTFLAYGMLRADQRAPALGLLPTVAGALMTSDGVQQAPFNLLGLAETTLHGRSSLPPPVEEAIATAILSNARFGSSTRGAPCYRRIGCYDNLKLVQATAVLAALEALPGRRGPAGSTFAVRARATRSAVRLLSETIPGVEISDAALEFGDARLVGAVLSDPRSDPPAYLALSSMMLGRSLESSGSSSPAAMRAFRRAIVALLGLTAPDGDISYMGRGQGQVWTFASAAAACALAVRLLSTDPVIDARCLGLVETELGALAIRRSLGGVGIATVPRLSWRRGVDHYVNATDYNGLCVYALNLTADALAGLSGPSALAPPGALADERFVDPAGTGLATVGRDGLWFAVHKSSTSAVDSRWGFGLMAMDVRKNGLWRSALTDRPLGRGAQGPFLTRAGHVYEPRGESIWAGRGTIVIHGSWFDGRHSIGHTVFVYEATPHGVVLRIPARAGDQLVMHEWSAPGEPTQLSALVPPRAQSTARARLEAGNDASDTLEQVSHTVHAHRDGLVWFVWHP